MQQQKAVASQTPIMALQQRLQLMQADYDALCAYGYRQVQLLKGYYQTLYEANTEKTRQFINDSLSPQTAGWSDIRWSSWGISPVTDPGLIRVGDFIETWDNGLSVPGCVPFIGGNRTIVIRCNDATSLQGLELLQSLIVRSAFILPRQFRYTLLDPSTDGRAFPMRRYLSHVRDSSTDDVACILGDVQKDIKRIIETYFDLETKSFEQIPAEKRLSERFQLVVAAHFPDRYEWRAIDALQKVGRGGPVAGVYVFIHLNTDYGFPQNINREEYLRDFKNVFEIDVTNIMDLTWRGRRLKLDTAPPPEIQSRLSFILDKQHSHEPPLPWENLVDLPESEWWQEDASQLIETPIGLRGGSEPLRIWFGVRSGGGQPCAHGVLAATTGAGKSNLYHVLISGFAMRYSPRDLRLYLIDGKDGVEFQPYRHLPHVEVVSLHSAPELSRSVLAELIAEKERRNVLFGRAGVTDLAAYRRKGQPYGNVPRILLLVDEYQQLFEDDREGLASAYLQGLAAQGRSAGIHLLLGSQRFGVRMLGRDAVFGNIHLRMAMQMAREDILALHEFGRKGKELIKNCDTPGKIVVNDRSGDDTANQTGKVVLLESEARKQLVQRLIDKAEQLPEQDLPQTVVFDGQEQPVLNENPRFMHFLRASSWLNAQELERHARLAVSSGGLGRLDWIASEHPHIVWLGQEFNVRGHAAIMFRRHSSENAALIGSSSAVRYGMLASLLTSLCAVSSPKDIHFYIVDRSIAGTPENTILQQVRSVLLQPAGYFCQFTKEAKAIEMLIDDLISILDERLKKWEEQVLTLPSIFVIMTELDRVGQLRHTVASYGVTESPLGLKLRRLLTDGPSLGIHLVLSFSGFQSCSCVIETRHGLEQIRHRIALQMPEEDSWSFVKGRDAATLQKGGVPPICALYFDREGNSATRFKPYTIEPSLDSSKASLIEQIDLIGKALSKRRPNP